MAPHGSSSGSHSEDSDESPNASEIGAISRKVKDLALELAQQNSATRSSSREAIEQLEPKGMEAAQLLNPDSPEQVALQQLPEIRVLPPTTSNTPPGLKTARKVRKASKANKDLDTTTNSYVGEPLLQSWTLTPQEHIELAARASTKKTAIQARTKAKVQFTRASKVQEEFLDYVAREKVNPISLKQLKGLQARVDDAAARLQRTQKQVCEFVQQSEMDEKPMHNLNPYRMRYNEIKNLFVDTISQQYVLNFDRPEVTEDLSSTADSTMDSTIDRTANLVPILRKLAKTRLDMEDESEQSEADLRQEQDEGLTLRSYEKGQQSGSSLSESSSSDDPMEDARGSSADTEADNTLKSISQEMSLEKEKRGSKLRSQDQNIEPAEQAGTTTPIKPASRRVSLIDQEAAASHVKHAATAVEKIAPPPPSLGSVIEEATKKVAERKLLNTNILASAIKRSEDREAKKTAVYSYFNNLLNPESPEQRGMRMAREGSLLAIEREEAREKQHRADLERQHLAQLKPTKHGPAQAVASERERRDLQTFVEKLNFLPITADDNTAAPAEKSEAEMREIVQEKFEAMFPGQHPVIEEIGPKTLRRLATEPLSDSTPPRTVNVSSDSSESSADTAAENNDEKAAREARCYMQKMNRMTGSTCSTPTKKSRKEEIARKVRRETWFQKGRPGLHRVEDKEEDVQANYLALLTNIYDDNAAVLDEPGLYRGADRETGSDDETLRRTVHKPHSRAHNKLEIPKFVGRHSLVADTPCRGLQHVLLPRFTPKNDSRWSNFKARQTNVNRQIQIASNNPEASERAVQKMFDLSHNSTDWARVERAARIIHHFDVRQDSVYVQSRLKAIRHLLKELSTMQLTEQKIAERWPVLNWIKDLAGEEDTVKRAHRDLAMFSSFRPFRREAPHDINDMTGASKVRKWLRKDYPKWANIEDQYDKDVELDLKAPSAWEISDLFLQLKATLEHQQRELVKGKLERQQQAEYERDHQAYEVLESTEMKLAKAQKEAEQERVRHQAEQAALYADLERSLSQGKQQGALEQAQAFTSQLIRAERRFDQSQEEAREKNVEMEKLKEANRIMQQRLETFQEQKAKEKEASEELALACHNDSPWYQATAHMIKTSQGIVFPNRQTPLSDTEKEFMEHQWLKFEKTLKKAGVDITLQFQGDDAILQEYRQARWEIRKSLTQEQYSPVAAAIMMEETFARFKKVAIDRFVEGVKIPDTLLEDKANDTLDSEEEFAPSLSKEVFADFRKLTGRSLIEVPAGRWGRQGGAWDNLQMGCKSIFQDSVKELMAMKKADAHFEQDMFELCVAAFDLSFQMSYRKRDRKTVSDCFVEIADPDVIPQVVLDRFLEAEDELYDTLVEDAEDTAANNIKKYGRIYTQADMDTVGKKQSIEDFIQRRLEARNTPWPDTRAASLTSDILLQQSMLVQHSSDSETVSEEAEYKEKYETFQTVLMPGFEKELQRIKKEYRDLWAYLSDPKTSTNAEYVEGQKEVGEQILERIEHLHARKVLAKSLRADEKFMAYWDRQQQKLQARKDKNTAKVDLFEFSKEKSLETDDIANKINAMLEVKNSSAAIAQRQETDRVKALEAELAALKAKTLEWETREEKSKQEARRRAEVKAQEVRQADIMARDAAEAERLNKSQAAETASLQANKERCYADATKANLEKLERKKRSESNIDFLNWQEKRREEDRQKEEQRAQERSWAAQMDLEDDMSSNDKNSEQGSMENIRQLSDTAERKRARARLAQEDQEDHWLAIAKAASIRDASEKLEAETRQEIEDYQIKLRERNHGRSKNAKKLVPNISFGLYNPVDTDIAEDTKDKARDNRLLVLIAQVTQLELAMDTDMIPLSKIDYSGQTLQYFEEALMQFRREFDLLSQHLHPDSKDYRKRTVIWFTRISAFMTNYRSNQYYINHFSCSEDCAGQVENQSRAAKRHLGLKEDKKTVKQVGGANRAGDFRPLWTQLLTPDELKWYDVTFKARERRELRRHRHKLDRRARRDLRNEPEDPSDSSDSSADSDTDHREGDDEYMDRRPKTKTPVKSASASSKEPGESPPKQQAGKKETPKSEKKETKKSEKKDKKEKKGKKEKEPPKTPSSDDGDSDSSSAPSEKPRKSPGPGKNRKGDPDPDDDPESSSDDSSSSSASSSDNDDEMAKLRKENKALKKAAKKAAKKARQRADKHPQDQMMQAGTTAMIAAIENSTRTMEKERLRGNIPMSATGPTFTFSGEEDDTHNSYMSHMMLWAPWEEQLKQAEVADQQIFAIFIKTLTGRARKEIEVYLQTQQGYEAGKTALKDTYYNVQVHIRTQLIKLNGQTKSLHYWDKLVDHSNLSKRTVATLEQAELSAEDWKNAFVVMALLAGTSDKVRIAWDKKVQRACTRAGHFVQLSPKDYFALLDVEIKDQLNKEQREKSEKLAKQVKQETTGQKVKFVKKADAKTFVADRRDTVAPSKPDTKARFPGAKKDADKPKDKPVGKVKPTGPQKPTSCTFCGGGLHNFRKCAKAKTLSHTEIWKIIKANKLCARCLQFQDHDKQSCKVVCSICKKENHNELMHLEGKPDTAGSAKTGDKPKLRFEKTSKALYTKTAKSGKTIFQTVKAHVVNPHKTRVNKNVIGRILLDSGSNVTLITRRLARELKLAGADIQLTIQVAGQDTIQRCNEKEVQFWLESLDGTFSSELITAITVDSITAPLEDFEFNQYDYPHLEQCVFNDLPTGRSKEIDILLASVPTTRLYTSLPLKGEENEPIAINTELGWVLTGHRPTGQEESMRTFHCNARLHSSTALMTKELFELPRKTPIKTIEKLMEDFNTLDVIGISREVDTSMTIEELEAVKLIEDKLTYDEATKTYSCPLLWKLNPRDFLDDNLGNALGVMRSTLKKLANKPEAMEQLNEEYAKLLRGDFCYVVPREEEQS